MDLFVAHQAVFPLTRGPIVIPPAVVDYAVPVSFSFFSREDRYSLRSDTVSFTALPLPAPGRPAGRDQRVVAQGLTLDLAIDPANGRVGEPIDVTARLSGVGNVALWPEPGIRWPAGFRAYAGETGTRVERSEEHTSELQSQSNLVCRLLLEKKKKKKYKRCTRHV